MNMLNGLLAFGALAFTIPLAIHLLFRSRFTTLDWGAMHLLESVVRINRRRLQLMNLLLLLLRCLIPIVLAFCLARPVYNGFQSLPGDAPRSLVIVMDDSRSMSVRGETGNTRFERARENIRQLLEDLTRRDEVILIRSSQVDSPGASMGAQAALGRLDEMTCESGPVDLGRMVRAGVEAARDAVHSQRQVLVVSDFASRNVDDGVIETLQNTARVMEQQPNQPVISFLNYGIDSDQLENVSIDSIAVDSPAVVAGRGAQFSARIRNAGQRLAQNLRLLWMVDGQSLPPRTISIPAGSTVTNRLTTNLDHAGVHEITLAVEHADALAADNRRSIGVDVLREINVVIIDGAPGQRALEGETDFLAIALSPFAFGGQDLPDAVRAEVVPQRVWEKQPDQPQPDVLVLANVKDFSADGSKRISNFVLGGGSLVFFDGDRVDPKFYNQGFSGDLGTLYLPGQIQDMLGTAAEDDSEPMAIGDLNPQYTPWGLLQSKDQPAFQDLEVFGYRKLTVAETSQQDDGKLDNPLTPPIVLWRMAGGDPLVLSARRGEGRVVQFALPCNRKWSNLPMQIDYLPMIQQLMLDLAGSRTIPTIAVGDGIRFPITEFDLEIPASPDNPQSADAEKDSSTNQTTEYTVTIPGENESELQPSGSTPAMLELAATSRPGPYRFRRTIRDPDGKTEIAETLRVAEVDPQESQLRDTDPERLSAAAEYVSGEVFQDVESLVSDDRLRRFGYEIWRWLLLGLLILMIAEVFIQQITIRGTPRREVSK